MLSRRATEFYAVAPPVRNVRHVTVVAPRILRWLLNFLGNLCNLDIKDENAAFGFVWHTVTDRESVMSVGAPWLCPSVFYVLQNKFKDEDNFSWTTLGSNPRKPSNRSCLCGPAQDLLHAAGVLVESGELY
jgi:hypothetical protein